MFAVHLQAALQPTYTLVFNVACCALCWGLAAAVLALHFPCMHVEGKHPDQSNATKYEFLQIEIKIIL